MMSPLARSARPACVCRMMGRRSGLFAPEWQDFWVDADKQKGNRIGALTTILTRRFLFTPVSQFDYGQCSISRQFSCSMICQKTGRSLRPWRESTERV